MPRTVFFADSFGQLKIGVCDMFKVIEDILVGALTPGVNVRFTCGFGSCPTTLLKMAFFCVGE